MDERNVSRRRKPGDGNRVLGLLNDNWAENEVIATLCYFERELYA